MLLEIDAASGIFQTDEDDTAQKAQLRRSFERREHERAAIALQKLHQSAKPRRRQVVRSVKDLRR
jgi:hypothetical protein